MRIGIVTPYFPPHVGGLEVVVAALAREFARAHEVAVITLDTSPSATAPESPHRLLRVPAIAPTEGFGVPYPVPLGPALAAARRTLASCDALHVHGALFASSVLAGAWARRRGLPFVLMEHAGWTVYRSSLLASVQRAAWRVVGRRLLAAADAVTTHSARIASFVEGVAPGTRPALVGNGVDSARFRPGTPAERASARREFGLPPDGTVVLFAGRPVDAKGGAALRDLRPAGWTLAVCGGDHPGLPAGTLGLGRIPHVAMHRALHAADVLVHPAMGEGVTLVVREALAAGVPVVMRWDAGHAANLDPDCVAGYTSEAELAPTLAALVADPARRAAMARAGRAWAERHWSWSAVAARHLELLAEVVEAARRRRERTVR